MSQRNQLGLALALLLATPVLAGQKVILKLRSPGTFHEVRTQLKSALREALSSKVDLFGNRRIERPRFENARVLDALENLNMVVVDVNSDAELADLRANSEVSFAEPEIMYPLPRMSLEARSPGRPETSSSEQTPWGITAVNAEGAWAAGTAGAGAKVAILDTGIDRDHEDLKTQILEGKNFFTKKADDEEPGDHFGSFLLASPVVTDAPETEETPPYEYYDQMGHGTHVAGTIAAAQNGVGVVGVAPQAKLLIGRVCGKFGCSSVAIVNGINWAMTQGADVISMSLGGPMDSDAQREALEAADSAGVVAIAASGNDGVNKISYPAAYPTVLAVGAVDSTLTKAKFSQWGPELAVMAPGVDVLSSVPQGSGRSSKVTVYLNGQAQDVNSTSFVGAPEVTTPFTGTLVAAGLGKAGEFPTSVRGNIALIKRGEIPFADKVKNAIQAGASGVLVYNNEAGLISGGLTQDGSTVAIPVVMIEQDIGEALVAAMNQGQSEKVSLQTLRTDYASFQGTSMATPHVSGVAALVRAANKKLTPAQVRQILKSTATHLQDTPDNQYGSGIVNAKAAVAAAKKFR